MIYIIEKRLDDFYFEPVFMTGNKKEFTAKLEELKTANPSTDYETDELCIKCPKGTDIVGAFWYEAENWGLPPYYKWDEHLLEHCEIPDKYPQKDHYDIPEPWRFHFII